MAPLVLALGGCFSLPGTSTGEMPRPDDLDGAVLDTSIFTGRDDAADGDDDGPWGSTDAPLSCGADDDPSCCGLFGFEDGTTQGFEVPACCADAFSHVQAKALGSPSAERACGQRALNVVASFVSATASGCEASPFAPACASQVGELSAPLAGLFDVRGKTLTGRVWLPLDFDASELPAEVRGFVVTTTGVIYGRPVALTGNRWQDFASEFADADDPRLGTASRWGLQMALRPDAIPDRQWGSPLWFDALGWHARDQLASPP